MRAQGSEFNGTWCFQLEEEDCMGPGAAFSDGLRGVAQAGAHAHSGWAAAEAPERRGPRAPARRARKLGAQASMLRPLSAHSARPGAQH